MIEQRIDLPSDSAGTQQHLKSLHFGQSGNGRKVYIQASLHADELPGMLVAQVLRQRLLEAEQAGRVLGEVVLVPVANPIGLAQTALYKQMGRFDVSTGINFNRNFPQWFEPVRDAIRGLLGSDADANKRLIRSTLRRFLESLEPQTASEALKRELMLLAYDADVVLDLHCDFESVMHLYTQTPCWPGIEPLARLLGCQAVLLNQQAGGHSFDEACGGPWWQLAEHFGPEFPIPQGCLDVTVELRGQRDVSHAYAQADAQAILDYLVHLGVIAGPSPTLPPLPCAPTPLAGSENIKAPHAGIVVFHREPGERLRAGDVVCDIIEPLSGRSTAIACSVDGVLYSRALQRYTTRGMDLADVAGSEPIRTGWLLSP